MPTKGCSSSRGSKASLQEDLPPPGLELRRRSLSVGGGFLRSASAAAEGDPVQLGADRIRVAQTGVQKEGRLETLTAADGSVRDGDAHDDPQRIARVRRLFDAESHARAVQGPEPPLHGGIVVRRPVFRGVALRPLRRPFPPGVGIPFRGRSLPHVASDAFRLRRPSRGRAERPRQQEDEQQRGQPFHRASALEYSENSQPKRSTIMLSISSAFSARFTMLRRISSSEASVMSDRWMR